MKKPNIVFFFTDQQRADTCGCYGQDLNVTPELDKMAREGVRFSKAFTCQPVCGPARSSLQTGKYATETGCFRNSIHLPQDEKTIAHYFNENFYKTGYIGKWHLATTKSDPKSETAKIYPDYSIKAIDKAYRGGWKDEWIASDVLEFTSHPFEGHMFDINGNKKEFKDQFRPDAQTDWALDFLDRQNDDNPFFLFLSYIEPHHQNDMNVSIGPKDSKEKFADFTVPGDLKGTKGSWREEYPDYLGCCNSLDQNLGRIREKLKDIGLDENTLIIFSSDHGSHFRTRNLEYKRSCHDSSIHIPLVICGPGFRGGLVNDDLVSLIDLPATFLAAADIPVPSYMRGAPLQSLIDGVNDNWREHVYLEISENHIGRAIRTKKWKYEISIPDTEKDTGWNTSGGVNYKEIFLYDLENDPFEKENLINNIDLITIKSELREIIKKDILDVEGLDINIT
ncbi:MAG: sulfatase-like hydrolase/transferase [Spirochaetaceae bacterium]